MRSKPSSGRYPTPASINRILSIVIYLYAILYGAYESHRYTSWHYVAASIWQYLEYWSTLVMFFYYSIATLYSFIPQSSSKASSDPVRKSLFLSKIYAGLVFPAAGTVLALWLVNELCNECLHSRRLNHLIPHHVHVIMHLMPMISAILEGFFFRPRITNRSSSLLLTLLFFLGYFVFLTLMATLWNGDWVYPVLHRTYFYNVGIARNNSWVIIERVLLMGVVVMISLLMYFFGEGFVHLLNPKPKRSKSRASGNTVSIRHTDSDSASSNSSINDVNDYTPPAVVIENGRARVTDSRQSTRSTKSQTNVKIQTEV